MPHPPVPARIAWFFIGFLVLCFFAASLHRPYVDPDVVIYADIGRAIYRRGLLPYEYAFDHKPVFIYYLYGFLTLLLPDTWPKFQIFSVIFMALTAAVTRAIAARGSLVQHFLVLAGLSLIFQRYAANTELYFAFFAMLCLCLVLRLPSSAGLALSGAVAAVAVNCNYLAAFLVGPGLLYALASEARGRHGIALLRLCIFMGGSLAGGILIFLPFLIKNPELVREYFATQARFLHGYGHGYASGKQLATYFSLVIPLVVLLLFFWQAADGKERIRNTMAIAFFSALAGSAVSGKFFTHYAYPLVPPLTVLFFISAGKWKNPALIATVAALAVPTGIAVARAIGPPAHALESYDFSHYREMKRLAGDGPVLSIHASHIPVYYADLTPLQPFIWSNHGRILYGPHEDEYYVGLLKGSPAFILAGPAICKPPELMGLPQTCAALAARYHLVKHFTDSYWESVDFYARNAVD